MVYGRGEFQRPTHIAEPSFDKPGSATPHKPAGEAARSAGRVLLNRMSGGGGKIGGFQRVLNALDLVFGGGAAPDFVNKPARSMKLAHHYGIPVPGVQGGGTDPATAGYHNDEASVALGNLGDGLNTITATASAKLGKHVLAKTSDELEGTHRGGGGEVNGNVGPVSSRARMYASGRGLEMTDSTTVKSHGLSLTGMTGTKDGALDAVAMAQYQGHGLKVGGYDATQALIGGIQGGNASYAVNQHLSLGYDAIMVDRIGLIERGSIHVGKKDGEGVDLSLGMGPKGLSTSVGVKVGQVRVAFVYTNGSIVSVMLDLGPKHPEANEVLRILLGMASAAANPIPFALALGFRQARRLLPHRKKKPPKPPKEAGEEPPVRGIKPAAGLEVAAVLTGEDFDVLSAAGLVQDGFLNLGMSADAFQARLGGLDDEEQRAALRSVYAAADDWLPASPEEAEAEDPSTITGAAGTDDG
jgi:hypothetical protein